MHAFFRVILIVNRFQYTMIIAVSIFLSVACSGAIRNSKQLAQDQHFIWLIDKHKDMSPDEILAANSDSDDIKLQNDRALAYIRIYKVDHSERLLLGILAKQDNFTPAYLNLSRLYAILTEKKRMQNIFRRMVLERKYSDAFLYNTALKLADQNRTMETEYLMISLGSHRKSIPANLWLASKYIEDEQYDQAIQKYEQVLSKDPKNSEAYFGIAWIYYISNNWALAFDYFQTAHKNQSREINLKFMMADCLYKQHQTDKALSIIHSANKKERTLQLIELHGLLLLRKDYKHDLKFLLNEMNDEDHKKALKQKWFGGQDQNMQKYHIIPEFTRMN